MSQKYQREIEEILREAGDVLPSKKRARSKSNFWRLLWLYIRQSLGGKTWSVTPGRVMLVAISLLLLALIFSRMVPGIGGPLALAGLLLFIIGYGLFFVRPPRIEKRWRGQLLDEPGTSWWDRFRRKNR